MSRRLIPAQVLMLLLFFPLLSPAQGDPLADLEAGMAPRKDFQLNTFTSTRVINAQSCETNPRGTLDFRISHRFGTLNEGAYNFFGLDRASMRTAFEYGLFDRLMAGVGRNTIEKTFDGFLKYKIIWQAMGGLPFTMTYFTSMTLSSLKPDPSLKPYYFSHRLAFTHQMILARKFSPAVSFQIMPTVVHRNLVETKEHQNDVVAIGAGGRIRISNTFALAAEYFYILPGHTADHFENSMSLALDVKTGGHDFQLALTNSMMMIEKGFIAETSQSWFDGGIHFGFNLARSFHVGQGIH